jgi:hypothetical protein
MVRRYIARGLEHVRNRLDAEGHRSHEAAQ